MLYYMSMTFNKPNPETLNQASPEELAELAAQCMERLTPGRQPLDLFSQVARLFVLSTVEVVPMRFNEQTERLDVLLAQRPDDCRWWPGQWHAPGTVLLETDALEDPHDFRAPVDRAIKGEFRGTVVRTGPIETFDAQRRRGARGVELSAFTTFPVDLAEGHDRPYKGEFFDAEKVVENPPEGGLVALHDELIIGAFEHVMSSRRR